MRQPEDTLSAPPAPLPVAHGFGADGSPGAAASRSGRHRISLRAARAFCEALFSADDRTAPPADRMDWLQGELDQLLCKTSWRPGGVYKLLLMLVCFVAPLYVRRLRPLWGLTIEDRVRALRRMERGSLAAVVLAAKAIMCLIYYEHPEVAREAGYTGGCAGALL
jgi:hypothetical protein